MQLQIYVAEVQVHVAYLSVKFNKRLFQLGMFNTLVS